MWIQGDAVKLGIQYDGSYYLDTSLVFGAVNGTAMFQHISDAVHRILASENICVWNYINDIFACLPASKAKAGYRRIVELVMKLGLPINDNKLVPPTEEMTCMGIVINADKKTIRLSDSKVEEILKECQDNMSKRFIRSRDLQSLLGKLLW